MHAAQIARIARSGQTQAQGRLDRVAESTTIHHITDERRCTKGVNWMSDVPQSARAEARRYSCILSRTPASIEAAMAQVIGNTRLADMTGRAAIFSFLRRSLRLELEGAASARVKRQCKAGKCPSQETVGVWLGKDRAFVDSLERADRRNQAAFAFGAKELILQVYFGKAARGEPLTSDAKPALRHLQPCSDAEAHARLKFAVSAADHVSVSDFVQRFFFQVAPPMPMLAAGAAPASEASRSSAATPATTQGLEGVRSRNLISLDALKPRTDLGRVHVPTGVLPTRAAQLEVLRSATSVRRQTVGAIPSHRMVVVSGPIGIGKSEFIVDWLIGLRDTPDRPFDDVLMMTHCAQLAEDVVAEEVRACLKRPDGRALIVLDGLRMKGEDLQWGQGPRLPSTDLVNLLVSQIGERPFVAVLGVQTPPDVTEGLPGRWVHHPRNPAVLVAEEIRLRPLPAVEASVYARAMLASRQPREDQIEAVVAWSGGLPLLLSAASVLPASGAELNLPGRQASAPGGAATWKPLRATLQKLNDFDGQHYATMRLVSLFRRPLAPNFIRKIVAAVRQTGLSIGRVDEASLLSHFHLSPFFSQGPEGRVELHDGVYWIVGQELSETIKTDPAIAREVRTIHLVASRLFYDLMAKRNPREGGGTPTAAVPALETQFDIELACDCVHHLLGTRCAPDERLQVPWGDETWAAQWPPSIRKAFSGMATTQEIEHFCFRTLLGSRNLEGAAFSSRGLFSHKLELLERFIDPWAGGAEQNAKAEPLRRTVRFEYAACSIVAGQLKPAERQLRTVLDELAGLEPELTAMFFGATDRKRQSHELGSADYCQELAKVSAAYASALMRSGRVAEVLALLQRVDQQVVVPALKWVRELKRGEEFMRELQEKTLRAHSRILVRLAEAEHLTSVPWKRPGTSAAPLEASLALFEHATRHQVEIGGLRAGGGDERPRPVDEHGVSRMLGGESARAFVRCLVAAAQIAAQADGRQSPEVSALMGRAHELVDRHLAALAVSQSKVGASNEAIGFRLLKANLEGLDGNFEAAEDRLRQLEDNPRYLNLGATSLSVKFEVRLTQAKLAMARAGQREMREELRADLQVLQAHAAETQHRLIQMDALLLLAIAARGTERVRHLAQARAVNESCPSLRARDDVFRWLEEDRLAPWTDLSLAG